MGGPCDANRVGRRLTAAVLALAATLATAGAADAGTYDVWSCRGPSNEPLPASAWERTATDTDGNVLVGTTSVEFGDTCAQANGMLSVALGQGALLSAPVTGTLSFRPPAATRILGYRLARRLQSGQAPLLATYVAERLELSSGALVSSESCGSACGTLGGPDAGAPASLVIREPAEGDELALRVRATCTLVCAELGSVPARSELYWARVTLEDVDPPDPPQIRGTLTEGEASGRKSLTVAAHDRGGGVEAVSLAIDGEPWQTVRSGATVASCRAPYSVPVPCPGDVEQPFEIDTGALAPGDHEASGTVVDAAGNTTPWGPVPFRVEAPTIVTPPPTIVTPPPPGPSNGVPAVERPRLRVARRVVEAPAGKRVRLRGRLTTLGGTPIRGARLEVTARQLGLRGTVPNRDRPTVVTDAAGRFSIVQRAHGARRVTVSFSPRPEAATTARSTATVRSRLSLRTAPSAERLVKGRMLTLRGRLIGAGRSARGALVQIQAIVNGRWRPVGRARAGRGGRYVWRYRFVHLTRDTVFRFRAVVEHVPGWPWPTVRAAPTAIRVDVP